MRRLAAALGGLLFAAALRADPEIMVHQGDLAEPGEVVATLHANHVLSGRRRSDDGTWPAHGLSNLMAEFSTGIAPGWEVGIHLPAMRAGVDAPNVRRGDWGWSAVMFRIKRIARGSDGWYWGFNAEYDINAARYVAERRSIEFRGIAGYDGETWRLAVNPHLIAGWGGGAAGGGPDFNVDFKLLRKAAPGVAWGAEFYTDWGRLADLQPGHGDRTLYLVGEFDGALGGLHVGIGRGFQQTPERLLVKAVWSTAF